MSFEKYPAREHAKRLSEALAPLLKSEDRELVSCHLQIAANFARLISFSSKHRLLRTGMIPTASCLSVSHEVFQKFLYSS